MKNCFLHTDGEIRPEHGLPSIAAILRDMTS